MLPNLEDYISNILNCLRYTRIRIDFWPNSALFDISPQTITFSGTNPQEEPIEVKATEAERTETELGLQENHTLFTLKGNIPNEKGKKKNYFKLELKVPGAKNKVVTLEQFTTDYVQALKSLELTVGLESHGIFSIPCIKRYFPDHFRESKREYKIEVNCASIKIVNELIARIYSIEGNLFDTYDYGKKKGKPRKTASPFKANLGVPLLSLTEEDLESIKSRLSKTNPNPIQNEQLLEEQVLRMLLAGDYKKRQIPESGEEIIDIGDLINRGKAVNPEEIKECASKNIPGYIIIKKMKESNFGRIYQAYDTDIREFAVLKELSLSKRGEEILQKRGQTLIDILRNEGRAGIFKLTHTHILPMNIIRDKDEKPLIAMREYDQTLEEVIKQRGPFSLGEVIKYTLQIADALAYCHNKNIIHDDLHGGNIGYIESEDSLYLADFGLSQVLEKQELVDKSSASEGIFAPRHTADIRKIEGMKSDYQSDVYSMGCLIYFMLVGKYPFSPEGLDKNRASQASAFEREAYSTRKDSDTVLDKTPIESKLKTIIAKCWNPNLNIRYKDARELLKALQDYSI